MEFALRAEKFLSAWNEGDMSALGSLLAADLQYSDAHAHAPLMGAAAYLDFVLLAREQLPNLRFELLASDEHGRHGLIWWRLHGLSERENSEGCFYVALNDCGTFATLVGFGDPRSLTRPVATASIA